MIRRIKRLVSYLSPEGQWIVAPWRKPQKPLAWCADRGEALDKAVELAKGGIVMVDFRH